MSGESEDAPPPAVAVSPGDQSSDREQSDANNVVAVAAQERASDERHDAKLQAIIDQGITNERIDRLIASSQEQTEASRELALATYAEAQSRVEFQERARLARRRFRVTVAVVILGLAGLYARQEYSLHASQDTRNRIIDCVDPAGQCFKDGQARTARVVGDLNKVTSLAAACAPNFVNLPLAHRIVAIEHCIQRNLH